VLGGENDREKMALQSCLGTIAGAVKRIAGLLKVSAICEVDVASGLPDYPIHGNLKFTQSVTFSSLSLNYTVAREEMTSSM